MTLGCRSNSELALLGQIRDHGVSKSLRDKQRRLLHRRQERLRDVNVKI